MDVVDYHHKYTFTYPYYQQFSIPDNIMYYIKFQSPKVWEKLIKTCKQFYAKHKFLPVFLIFYSQNCWIINDCHSSEKVTLRSNINSIKFWLQRDVALVDMFSAKHPNGKKINIIQQLIPKIFRCDAKKLTLYQKELFYDEFEIFTSSGTIEDFYCVNVIIKYRDESLITFDKVLSNLQNVKQFFYFFDERNPIFLPDTVTKAIKLLHGFNCLKNFSLHKVNASFDFMTFKKYMEKHQNIHFHLDILQPLSDNYKDEIHKYKQNLDQNTFHRISFS